MFTRKQTIRFKHCDPAGIVFYPRYFEIINDTVEDYFGAVLSYPFHRMMPANGVPTVAIQTQFHAPSRHGDSLDITLHLKRVGRTSVTLQQIAKCAEELRFDAELTLVHVDETGASTPWPETVAQIMTDEQEGNLR